MRKERQTIELLKLIANQDLSKLIDKYDYLGVQLAYRSYATDILRANDIQCISKVETDEDRLREVEEYRTNNRLKMEKDLEKQIEEAAVKSIANDKATKQSPFSCFINGAKSQEAKEYWQQGTYSEEEVMKLCYSAMKERDYTPYCVFQEWFEQNKKK